MSTYLEILIEREKRIAEIEPLWPSLDPHTSRTTLLNRPGVSIDAADGFIRTIVKLAAIFGSREVLDFIDRELITYRQVFIIAECLPNEPTDLQEWERRGNAWAEYLTGDYRKGMMAPKALALRHNITASKAHQLAKLYDYLLSHGAMEDGLSLDDAIARFKRITRAKIPFKSPEITRAVMGLTP